MTLTAKELRIGNLYDHSGRVKKVTPIVIEALFESERFWCKAIPLTEEWLLKFGFIGQPCGYTKDKLSVCLKGSDSFHKAGRTYYNSWAILEKQPTYVHQLQNLYFALTNKELNYETTTI